MALIALHDSVMKVVHRFHGLCPAEECIDVFTRTANQLDPLYVAIRAERYILEFQYLNRSIFRASRDAGRSIREQQDAAYQLSLKADREKKERLEREKEEQERKERQEQEFVMDIEKQREVSLWSLLATYP